MRKQYNLWRNGDGYDAWDVDRLIELSRDLPVKSVPIGELSEVDANYWSFDEQTTVRDIAHHVQLVNDVDLHFPIILAANGRIMDGMHRVVRALLEHRESIEAVRFVTDPEPDFRNCQPEELPF